MRLIKMLGLAAIAAIAATAIIGASSASATWTVICKVNELVCPEASRVELKELHFLAEDPKLLTNLGTVLCKYALFLVEVLHLAKPLEVHIKEIRYIECTFGGTGCTVTTTHLGLPHLLKTAPNLGEILDLENGGSYTTVHVECGKSLNCEYKGEGLTGHVLGTTTEAGRVTYNEATVTKIAGGFLCPTTSKLDAVFVDLHTTELYIAE